MWLIEQLLQLPVLWGAGLLMALTTLVGLGVYMLSNRLHLNTYWSKCKVSFFVSKQENFQAEAAPVSYL